MNGVRAQKYFLSLSYDKIYLKIILRQSYVILMRRPNLQKSRDCLKTKLNKIKLKRNLGPQNQRHKM